MSENRRGDFFDSQCRDVGENSKGITSEKRFSTGTFILKFEKLCKTNTLTVSGYTGPGSPAERLNTFGAATAT